jgi:hypothetical protein
MLLAVGSVKASPGATTAAVALGARWPVPGVPVVVECDPAGGDLLARFGLEPYPGLVSLAAAARRTSEPGLLWQHTQRLPGGLGVVVGAMGGEQAKAALDALASSGGTAVLRQAADDGRTVVIADCGRVDSASAALPVVRAADALVLLARPRADELAHLAALLPSVSSWCGAVWLVLVGDGYRPRDVTRELGVPVLGALPHDPPGAAVLAGQPGARRGPDRSALGQAAAQVAAVIRAQALGTGHRVPAATGLAGVVRGAGADAWSRT